jgi:hypothetical protein
MLIEHNNIFYYLFSYICITRGSESRITANVDEKLRKQAEALHKTIEGQIKNKIEGFKYINYNPNTKGAGYEQVISDLLNAYLGSRFDFYTRAQLVDREMQYTRIFQRGAREVDVVGIFNTTAPKIVLKAGKHVIIPYDAIALLSEVKSVLNKKYLEEDLEKLEKIMQLKIFDKRFLPKDPLGFKDMRADIPFRLLIYFKTSIDNTVMEDLLTRYSDFWDVVFLVDKEWIILNRNLPFVKSLYNDVGLPDSSPDKKFQIWTYAPFMILLAVITRTIPLPAAVDVMSILSNIATLARKKKNQIKGRR